MQGTEERKVHSYTEIWRDIGKAYKIMYKGMDTLFQQNGSNVLEYRILRVLSEEGQKTMATLAEMNFVTQAWITGLVDKLEDKEHVKRIRSNKDRRVIYVEITKKGGSILEEMKKIHDDFLKELLAFVSEEEAGQIEIFVRNFRKSLEAKLTTSENK